jgi:hypothetical protein
MPITHSILISVILRGVGRSNFRRSNQKVEIIFCNFDQKVEIIFCIFNKKIESLAIFDHKLKVQTNVWSSDQSWKSWKRRLSSYVQSWKKFRPSKKRDFDLLKFDTTIISRYILSGRVSFIKRSQLIFALINKKMKSHSYFCHDFCLVAIFSSILS